MSEQENDVTQPQESTSTPQAEAVVEPAVVEVAGSAAEAVAVEPATAEAAPATAPATESGAAAAPVAPPAQGRQQGGENRRQPQQRGEGQRKERGPREGQGPREGLKEAPRGDRPPREGRGPGGGGERRDRAQGGRGPGREMGRDRRPEPPADIDLEKLIVDSLYLDNQAHAIVIRMRDMDSGTRSQLRRLFSAVRRACRAVEADRQHQFVMLRARLAYTIARHQLRSLDTLEKLLLQVTRKNDPRGYERFRDLFEAIVAYNE